MDTLPVPVPDNDHHIIDGDVVDVTTTEQPYTFSYICKDKKIITITLPTSASGDEALLRNWLFSRRSAKTEQAYAREIERFYRIVRLPLIEIRTVDPLYDFQRHEEIAHLKDSSQARALAAVKSLLTYASNIAVGAIQINVGAAVQLPPVEDTLAERIMSEQSVDDMIRLETDPRNQAMLELFYYAALRVEELCNLKWRHLQERNQSGQVAVYGKGQKTRYILLDTDTWLKVWALRGTSKHQELDDYVFTSRQAKLVKNEQGEPIKDTQGKDVLDYGMDQRRVRQIVRAAADRAGVAIGKVSPHWLRHAHASHAIDNGEPISLVSATLGHKSVAVTSRYLHVRPNASSAVGLRKAQKKRNENKE
jgi:integrase/recombinase XerD